MPIAAKGSLPKDRNWNSVPNGIVIQTSGSIGTTSSRSPCLRHISPRPRNTNQISSTVLWVTAMDVLPGPSSKWANPPLSSPRWILTSEPSGAISSRSAGRCLVSNSTLAPPSPSSSCTERIPPRPAASEVNAALLSSLECSFGSSGNQVPLVRYFFSLITATALEWPAAWPVNAPITPMTGARIAATSVLSFTIARVIQSAAIATRIPSK